MSPETPAATQVHPLPTPAARFVTSAISSLVWLIPFVLIAWAPVRNLDVALFGFGVVTVFGSALVAAMVDPTSLRNREGHDRKTELIVGVCTFAAVIWAAIDYGRLHWSSCVPEWLRLAAVVVLVFSYGLRVWAVTTNAFFSSLLVIQEERRHRVVEGGPYAIVRHPGNLSIMLIAVFGPLALNSLLALIPMGVALIRMFVRTSLEDRFLQANLGGYPDYVERVRYRILPGIY